MFWTQRLFNGDGVGQLSYVMNQSLNGALARLVEPDSPSRLVWVLLVLPVLGYGMWRARRAALAGDELIGMTIAGFVGSLISPLTWAHHIFWFAPALLAMIDTATSPAPALANVRSGLRNRWALLVLVAAMYGTIAFNTLEYYEFSLRAPGGLIGLVFSNWLLWLMLLLVVLLPIDPARASVAPEPAAPGAVRAARTVPMRPSAGDTSALIAG
jgi:alpha-1,2-mannosyltransferase